MLPFLRPRDGGGGSVAVIKRESDNPNKDEDMHGEGIKAAAKDLILAVHSHDDAKVASALRAAFELLDSEPHAEGPHLNESEE